MKECFAITTYCNTEEKIQVLNRTINDIKQYGFPIFIHAHYPLPEYIQKSVYSYFFSSDNPILKNRFNKFWYMVDKYKLEITVYDYYYTTLKGWSESIKICSDYDRIHIINYDTNLPPELFNLSRKYDKSIFLQNRDLSSNYISPTYFCLNKKSFEYFRENITLEKYVSFNKMNGSFLPLIEEFVPTFTYGVDGFYQVPYTEFDQDVLLLYDVASETRFDWNKTLQLNDAKIFIGELNGYVSILFFDVQRKTDIIININNYIENFNITSTHLFNLKMTYNEITSLGIQINNINVNENLIKTLFHLESKIFSL